jgi:hypothetical protein
MGFWTGALSDSVLIVRAFPPRALIRGGWDYIIAIILILIQDLIFKWLLH